MPGSLLGLGSSKVRRSESGRSDRSDISAYSADSRNSGKKVSFNRAVRVKKYPRRGDSNAGDDALPSDVSPEKRFWFKVYKNRHPNSDIYGSRKTPDASERDNDYGGYGKLRTIAENGDGPRSLPNLRLTSDVGVGTDSRSSPVKHGSPSSPEIIPVRPNHVKKIVNKFNDEAVIKFHRNDDPAYPDDDDEEDYKPSHSTPRSIVIPNGTGHRNPPEPPVDYGENSNGTLRGLPPTSSKSKRNPLINGVKVIFGMTQLKKRVDERKKAVDSKNAANLRKSQGTSTREQPVSNGVAHKGPFKTSILLADEHVKKNRGKSAKEAKTKEAGTLTRRHGLGGSNWELNNNHHNHQEEEEEEDNEDDKRLAVIEGERRMVGAWDSGDQLVSDRSRFESSVDKTPEGRFFRSSGEQSRVWRNEKRTVYEEERPGSPVSRERRAKSHGDLRLENDDKEETRPSKSGKVLSSEDIYGSREKSYSRETNDKDFITRSILSRSRGTTKDKASQCHPPWNDDDDDEDEEKSNINRYRVIRSKDGYVSAFSDVPSLDSDKGGKSKSPSMASTLKTNGTLSSDAIYSMVDKSKKKKKQAYVIPSPRATSPVLKSSKGYPSTVGPESTISGSDTLKKVKQTHKGFGFRLKKAFGGSTNDLEKGNTYKQAGGGVEEEDDNWYDVDADVAAAEKRGKKNGPSSKTTEPVRSPEDELSSSASNDGENGKRDSTPASVIREMNHKKREISYENVPHVGSSHGREISAGGRGGLWFRDADEDYRREMAQSDVSYPSGSHVGNNHYEMGSSATLGRLRDKRVGDSRDDLSRSYTLDRRHTNGTKTANKSDKNDVKILLNGHEIDNVDDFTSRLDKSHRKSQKHKKDENRLVPSSVQSDPVHHRGGLAAAYKARQKAALKRSNSSAGTGSIFGSRLKVNGSPSRTRRGHQSSGGSMVSSSDSDSARRRRTLVMYIPGISHPEHRASDDDKLSRVSRTQSMHSAAKPPRYQKNPKSTSQSRLAARSNSDISEEGDTITPLRSEMKRKSKSPGDSIGRSSRDLRRRHSMPKDTKFGWLKWKIKGKPAKEA